MQTSAQAHQSFGWQPIMVALAGIGWVTILFYGIGWSGEEMALYERLAQQHEGGVWLLVGWPPLLNTVYTGLAGFTPPHVLLAGGAVLSALVTFQIAAFLLRRYVGSVLALCGAVVLTAYAWKGEFIVDGAHWSFPVLLSFALFLVPRKRPVGLVAVLVLTALVSPGLVIIEALVLVIWLLGEGLADAAQPALVRATINAPRVFRAQHWLVVAGGMLVSAALVAVTYNSAWSTVGGQMAEVSSWQEAFSLWGADAGAKLGMKNGSAWTAPLILGASTLGLIYYSRFGSLTWLQLSLITVGLVLPLLAYLTGAPWLNMAEPSICWRIAAPLALVIILGAGAELINVPYVNVAAGAVLLVWTYAYLGLA